MSWKSYVLLSLFYLLVLLFTPLGPSEKWMHDRAAKSFPRDFYSEITPGEVGQILATGRDSKPHWDYPENK